MTGDDLRLTYALYRGDPPADLAEADPYRRAYVWVDVPTPVTEDDERGDRVSDTPTVDSDATASPNGMEGSNGTATPVTP